MSGRETATSGRQVVRPEPQRASAGRASPPVRLQELPQLSSAALRSLGRLLQSSLMLPGGGLTQQHNWVSQAQKPNQSGNQLPLQSAAGGTLRLPAGRRFDPEDVSPAGRIQTGAIEKVFARIPDRTTDPGGYIVKRNGKLFPTEKLTAE